ncbi:MAG: helix-turn-helix domain-containing protein [Gammaproteobacteria bacterium]
MSRKVKASVKKRGSSREPNRLVRADAQRNLESLLRAALAVFEKSGVAAPVREIAEKAGVGVGTLYRHFPERSDLIKAVVRQEIDACAEAASLFGSEHEPGEALARWMQRLVDLIATKRGLATALHSGNSTYQSLPEYFLTHLTPALKNLLDAARAAGAIRAGVDAGELLLAGARLATPASEGDAAQARRMVALLVDGLRYGAGVPAKTGR